MSSSMPESLVMLQANEVGRMSTEIYYVSSKQIYTYINAHGETYAYFFVQ